MFSLKFQLRIKSIKSKSTINRSNLAPFFTHTTVCDQQTEEQQQQFEESITNRSYWTKRIHKLCAIDHNVDEAIRLVDNLTVHGYHLDSLNLSSIIHALCDSNRYVEAHTRFISSISSSSSNRFIIPDEKTCNVIIARLLNWGEKPHDTLRAVRRIMAVKPHFVPSLMNFNRLIDQFCSFSFVHYAHILLYHMKSLGHYPNVVSYTTLIKGYCRIGELSYAHKVFDEMSEYGINPNSLTYSVLFRGAVSKKDADLEKSLLDKLWKTMADDNQDSDGNYVNHAAFSNLIYSLCEVGSFKSVFEIAEKMPQGKNVNESFAYNQMIDSLCRYKRYHGASRIVYLMTKRGFIPSLISYNSIIHGLTKNNGYLRAYQLLEQGTKFGYTPSENTYKILTECVCSQEHDLIKPKKILEIMLTKKDMEKVKIYNIFLRALCLIKNDVSTELLNTLVIMLEANCHPDVVTLNTVILGFCKMGKIDEGLKVLNDMIMGKFNFCNPDNVTFTTIISGLLDIGRTQDAFDILYKTMPEKGFHPKVITYNVVIRGLFKLNLANEAIKVFNFMISGGVFADCTTYALIIDGLCKCNRLNEAKLFWDDVIWPSGMHDNFVYSAIINGLCSSGMFNEGCDFIYELVDCGVKPNIFNYNILINCACNLGLKKEAYQIVGEMRKNGVDPDSVTWRIIDKLHKRKKQSGFEDAINR